MNGDRYSFGFTGDDIKHLHDILVLLGYSISEAERAARTFGDSTLTAVKRFQETIHLPITGVVDEATAKALQTSVEAGFPFAVSGVVRSTFGIALNDVAVEAWDRDWRSNQQLGQTRTDSTGSYEIRYRAPQFTPPELRGADVWVGVPRGDGTYLARSPTRFNAPAAITIDLTIAAEGPLAVTQSEVMQVMAIVVPVLLTVSPAEITDDDLEFLSGEYDRDRDQFACAVAASARVRELLHRDLSETLQAALLFVFYGCFRKGLPRDLAGFLARGPDAWRAAVAAATAANILPPTGYALDDAIAVLVGARTDADLAPAGAGQPASLRDLLDKLPTWVLPDDPMARTAVVDVLRDRSPDDPGFADALQNAGLAEEHVVPVHRTMRLAALTDRHPVLISALQDRVAKDGDASLRALAAIAPVQWLDLAYAHGTPPGSATDRHTYAAALAASVEALHPTATLHERLAQGTLRVDAPGTEQVPVFLAANPTFDIARATIADFKAWSDEEQPLKAALLGFQRLKTLSATWSESAALLRAGVGDAARIVRLGADGLYERTGSEIDAGAAARLYEHAKAAHDLSIGLMAKVVPAMNRNSAKVLPGSSFKPEALPASLHVLFGDLDACACAHCDSVLGPAAYLVDLLQLVRASASAWAELAGRRPDLLDVELSCDNTDTTVPHIDLVLETLENAVGLPLGFDLGATPPSLATAPLPAPVLAALRQTAAISGEAEQHLVGVQRGAVDPFLGTPWAVTDGYRRWCLYLAREQFWVSPPEGAGFVMPWRPLFIEGAAAAALVAALDKGLRPVSPALDALIAPETPQIVNSPFAVVDLPLVGWTVAPIEAGRRWAVSCTAQLRVEIVDDELRLLRPSDGATLSAGRYTPTLLGYLREQLDAYYIGEPLASLLANNNPAQLTVAIVAGGWSVTAKGELELHHMHGSQLVSLAYQTVPPSDQPLAQPTNRNDAAYVRIRGARFPWTLPYDQPLAEIRALLARGGTTLRQLRESAFPGARLTDTGIAAEVLGISDAERSLIAGADTSPGLWACWGVESEAAPLEALKRVSALLRQSRLDIATLQEVLDTRFVGLRWVPTPPGTCKPSEMRLEGLTADHLDRIHRFVRLWRRLGWKIYEVDLAIGAGEIDLVRLAQIVRLREATRLPIAVLAACFYGLGTREYRSRGGVVRSLYQTRFENPSIHALDPAFALSGDDTVGSRAQPMIRIADRLELVAAALGVSAADLERLGSTADPISLAALSARFGVATFARAASLSIADAVLLAKLASLAPSDPERALRFLDLAGRVRGSGFSVGELAYLVDHDLPRPATSGTDTEASQLAARLAADLGSIQPVEVPAPLAADLVGRVGVSDDRVVGLQLDASLAELVEVQGRTLSTLQYVDDSVIDRLRPVVPATVVDALYAALSTLRERTIAELAVAPAGPSWDTEPLFSVESAASFLSFATAEDRLVEVTARLAWRRRRARTMATLAAWFGTDEATMADIVFSRLAWPDVPMPPTTALVRLLRKCTLVVARLAPRSRLDWLATGTPADRLRAWQDLARLATLRTRLTPALFDSYLAALAAPAPHDAERVLAARRVVAVGVGIAEADANAAADLVGLVSDDVVAHRDPARLEHWIDLLLALRATGANAEQLAVLVARPVGAPAARIARSLLRTKYGADRWVELVTPISDRLREQQRDVLVDYLIHRDRLRDANELYARYLIDPQMSPAMQTTRVLAATGAMQLFVQRCLARLEPGVSPDKLRAERWEWMKSYRVWEANRKVFLYPENWLFPELRDDKTELFRQLEGALGKEEASDDVARGALLAYLDGLAELAQIRVLGLYLHEGTLYLVGRSPNPPHRYFWRKCAQFGGDGMVWTAWEKLDFEISGVHVMPFVVGSDLHLGWPEVSKDSDTGGIASWTFSLRWARLTSGGWKDGKSAGVERQKVSVPSSLPVEEALTFRVEASAGTERVLLHCYRAVDSGEGSLAPPQDPPAIELDGPGNTFYIGLNIYVFYCYQAEYTHASGAQVWLEIESTDDDHHEGFANFLSETGFESSRLLPLTNSDGVTQFSYGRDTPHGPGFDRARFKLVVRAPAGNADVELALNIRTATFVKNCFITVGRDTHDLAYQAKSFDMKLDHTYLFDAGEEVALLPSPPPDVQLQAVFPDAHFSGNGYTAAPGTNAIAFAGITMHPSAAPFQLLAAGPSASSRSDDPGTVWCYQDTTARYLVVGPVAVPDVDTNMAKRTNPFHARVVTDHLGYIQVFRRLARSSDNALFQTESQLLTDGGVGALAHALAADPMTSDGLADRVSFDRRSPTAVYDWELFFHLPLAVANHLSRQQRFADAARWLQFVFDPTNGDPGTGAERYWRFLPFREAASGASVDALVAMLANPAADPTASAAARAQVTAWLQQPFHPHAVARLRTSAYAWRTVLTYLDNLIAWGDSLFRRDTREAIQEAALLYVLAADLLGPRPEVMPRTGRRTYTYRDLDPLWGRQEALSNAWLAVADSEIMRLWLAWLAWLRAHGVFLSGSAADQTGSLTSLGELYFCVPRNDELDRYWDTVDDRLFKIRHSLTLDGASRDLPLFDPPIDPELLVRAAAAGVDLGAALADLGAPSPCYRFSVLSQKATELASETRSLGASLLAALEKRDAEHLSLLRAQHETNLLRLNREVRLQQQREAEATVAGLRQGRVTTAQRYVEYQRRLGNAATVPPEGTATSLLSPGTRLAPDVEADEAGLGMLVREKTQLDLLTAAQVLHVIQGVVGASASVAFAFGAAFDPTLTNMVYKVAQSVGHGANAAAGSLGTAAEFIAGIANRSAILAGYERRKEEWVLQANQAALELAHIDRQIAAAQVRVKITAAELDTHDAQTDQSREIEDVLKGKFTSEQLYDWMVDRLVQVHHQSWLLAYDMAKRAERAFRRDLGLRDSSYVQYGSWDSRKQGLLAGEQLHQDLKRMEAAYLDQNRREYEITKHVSLAAVNPEALLALKRDNTCELFLPEVLFDLDFPGHYLRRIKSVSVTIPCVTGPYTSVNCTLTLQSSSVRHDTKLDTEPNSYLRDDSGRPDPRFTDIFAPIESIVTSSGNNDTGMFDPNLRDERYLPFEGAGVISHWSIKLPKQWRQLDYNTITDVVLHVRYTARDGGKRLKDAAEKLLEAIQRAVFTRGKAGLLRLFSLRHDFPDAWRSLESGGEPRRIAVTLDGSHFPLLVRQRPLQVVDCTAYAEPRSGDNVLLAFVRDAASTTPEPPPWRIAGTLSDAPELSTLRDLWLVVAYTVGVE